MSRERELTDLCNIWETEVSTEPNERSKWYEMALRRCAGEVRKFLAAAPVAPRLTFREWFRNSKHFDDRVWDTYAMNFAADAYNAALLAQPAPPPAPVSQAREMALKLVCEHTQWNESTPSDYVLAWAAKIESALTAAEKRAREKALEDACGMMCPRCKKGHKPQQQDRDGYISNFGPVSYGEWLHPWAEDEQGWRYCEASYIRTALATPSGAAQGVDKP
jgi:hypothetical protein